MKYSIVYIYPRIYYFMCSNQSIYFQRLFLYRYTLFKMFISVFCFLKMWGFLSFLLSFWNRMSNFMRLISGLLLVRLASSADCDAAAGPLSADNFEEFLREHSRLAGGGRWECFLCGKITSHVGNMRQHFETHHWKVGGPYVCKICQRVCSTRNALACHLVKCRRLHSRH